LPHPVALNSRVLGTEHHGGADGLMMSAPVREIVPAMSVANCSGTLVCRASMCRQERITIAITALSGAARPNSVCSGGHGLSSSFSAMQNVYLAGVPWVA
jgi:hypothetical protein